MEKIGRFVKEFGYMNEFVSNLQNETKKDIYKEEFSKRKNQDEIKRIILISLGMDNKIIENPRAFERISKKMDSQLNYLGIKDNPKSVIEPREIEKIVKKLSESGWMNVPKIGFVIRANFNRYSHGRKKIQKDHVTTEYRKETRFNPNSNSGNYIDIDELTILRINPNLENEKVIVGNVRTCLDFRGVEVQRIDSRVEYNHQNAVNLRDYYNPTEKDIMEPIQQLIRDGDKPIKSHNGFLKGRCLVFNRYAGENEGAGRLQCHSTGKDNKIKHTEPRSIDLTRMEEDIAKLDKITLRDLDELDDYVFDPYDKRLARFRRRRLEIKMEESKILGSISKEER